MNHPVAILVLFVLALIVLDLIALRFATDSRQPLGDRRDW